MKYFLGVFLFYLVPIFAEEITEDSKPLLRVFPIYRIEECEWAIQMFICQKCIQKKEKYAQKIYFYSNGPYREHGCYTDSKGFYTLKPENND